MTRADPPPWVEISTFFNPSLSTVLLKGSYVFEKSSRVWYIFLKAIFGPEKEKKIWKCLAGKKPTWKPYLLKEAS